ncbi:MAG: hypothetical protein M1832_004342 [Thelocarpon impressellum]|nr:MAG: hypothetical protein M1832_004342 [Thelocarpon impressellum]
MRLSTLLPFMLALGRLATALTLPRDGLAVSADRFKDRPASRVPSSLLPYNETFSASDLALLRAPLPSRLGRRRFDTPTKYLRVPRSTMKLLIQTQLAPLAVSAVTSALAASLTEFANEYPFQPIPALQEFEGPRVNGARAYIYVYEPYRLIWDDVRRAMRFLSDLIRRGELEPGQFIASIFRGGINGQALGSIEVFDY